MNLLLTQKIATLAGVGSIVFLIGSLFLLNSLVQRPTQIPTQAASDLNFYQDGNPINELTNPNYLEDGLYAFSGLSLCNDGSTLKQARVTHWLANLTTEQKALIDSFQVSNESYHNLYPGSVGNDCLDFDVTIQMQDVWGEEKGQLELLVAAQEPFVTVGFLSIKLGTPTPTPITCNTFTLTILYADSSPVSNTDVMVGTELRTTDENGVVSFDSTPLTPGVSYPASIYGDVQGVAYFTLTDNCEATIRLGPPPTPPLTPTPTSTLTPTATPPPACPTLAPGCKPYNLTVTNVTRDSVSVSWTRPLCDYDRFILDVVDIAADNIVCTIRDLAKDTTQATCTLPSGQRFVSGRTYHVNLRVAKWGEGCWSDELAYVPFSYTDPTVPPPPTFTPTPGCQEKKPENPINLNVRTFGNCNNQVVFSWQAGGETAVGNYALEIETSAIESPPWSSSQEIWRGRSTSTGPIYLGFPDTFNRDRRWRVVAYSTPTGCAHGRTEAPLFRISCSTTPSPSPSQGVDRCVDANGDRQDCSAAGDRRAGTVYGQCCAVDLAKSVHRICGESDSDRCRYECFDLAGRSLDCNDPAACVHNAPDCAAGHQIGEEIKLPSQGDVNGPQGTPDGIINGYDASLLIRAWGGKTGDDKYNPAVDLDGNNRNDALDASIMVSNWSK